MPPTLPQITPRAGTQQQYSHINAQFTLSEPKDGKKGQDKFSKLKSVLVSNVLKIYHKKFHKQADEAIYSLALQEVNKILSNGKLTEQKLRELQKNFANGIAQDSVARQIVSDITAASPDHMDFERNELNGFAMPAAAEATGFQAPKEDSRSSPMKGRSKLDEWSVLTLYDDVKHLEEVSELKQRRVAEKMRTRSELQVEIERRKREKEQARAAELALAQQQKEVYEAWQKEKARVEEERKAKVLEERNSELQVMFQAQQKKKLESEQERSQEQERMRELERQIEADKKRREQAQMQKKVQYQQTLVDNQNVLRMKQQRIEQEREEDARLFQLQVEMAEKQERWRAEQEQQRLAKLKAAERVASVMGDRAAEIEAQVEERVRKAEQERQQREVVQDRAKREARDRRQQDVLTSLQHQVQEHNEARARRAAEERALAERLRAEAEEYRRSQATEKSARRRTQLEQRAELDRQRQLKAMQREQQGGMSETEMRINAVALQRVALK
jgi:hypothetical protein